MKKLSFFVIAFFENGVSLAGKPISNANSIFLEHHSVLFLSSVHYRSSIDDDNIKNPVHPLYIIVDSIVCNH